MKAIVLVFFITISGIAFSQNNSQLIEDVTEKSVEEINESGQNEIPDELNDLINHPIDINGDISILTRYSLISNLQEESLRNYKMKMGKLVELEELQQVEYFDKKTILSIVPYCTVIEQKQEVSRSQLTLRFQKALNKKEEYYNGSDAKLLIRYRGNIKSIFKITATFEKDEGEEIFTRNKKGFDFNSFSILYNGRKIIRKIIIGDYNIEFGQGLTAWTGLGIGSGSSITGIFKNGRGLVQYSGTDENRFFRGIAISFEYGKWKTDVWISHHSIDGNITTDTLTSEEYVSSLQTSGYHRTYSETMDFHSQLESSAGLNVCYVDKKFSLGLISLGEKYSIPIQPAFHPYSKYAFSGNNNINSGVYYKYSYRNILFFGEYSYSFEKATSLLSGLLMSIDPKCSVGLIYRSYSPEFISLKSNAFGTNSANSNEHGLYIGFNYKMKRQLVYSCYMDVYSFPYLKYRVDNPSHGTDFFHQLDILPTRKFSGQIRFRNKLKQQNDNENSGVNRLANYHSNSLRISARFKLDNTWEYGWRMEYSFQNKNEGKYNNGTMISQDIFFHPMGTFISANARYAIFNCPEFDNRIYEYENDLQGSFSIPFYYGTGSRFYFNMSCRISPKLNLSCRYSKSWVDDELKDKSDIKVQLRMSI